MTKPTHFPGATMSPDTEREDVARELGVTHQRVGQLELTGARKLRRSAALYALWCADLTDGEIAQIVAAHRRNPNRTEVA